MPPVLKKKLKEHRKEGQNERKGKKKREGEKIQDDLKSKPDSEKSEIEEKMKKLKALMKDQDELVVGLRIYPHKDCAAVVGRLKTDLW